MRLQDALPQFLLPPVDVGVKLVAVLADRKLLVVVDRDVNAARTHRLILRIVELGDVGMTKGLFSCQTSIWVELQKVTQQVESVVRSRGKHISKALGLGWRQRFQHRGRQRTVYSLDIFA